MYRVQCNYYTLTRLVMKLDEITVHVKPGFFIGELKLGMSKSEIDKVTQNYPFFLKFEYQDGKCSFIDLFSSAEIKFVCLYEEFDLFNTKASVLIPLIDNISPYDRDKSDGYSYYFPEIGLSFWRDMNLTEENMQEHWFKDMSPENQEDTAKHLYFGAVGV
ncbi:hypothetical protein PMSD_17175 [Paenibacillus macquariensis subsp. defensor]|nr:hypothetical protein PMSD_17175 [Paenibacillus macquariensis subsp. defensor]